MKIQVKAFVDDEFKWESFYNDENFTDFLNFHMGQVAHMQKSHLTKFTNLPNGTRYSYWYDGIKYSIDFQAVLVGE